MKNYKKKSKHNIAEAFLSLLGVYKASVSTAKLDGYNGRSFEKTMESYWKCVADFSCNWQEGWSGNYASDVLLSADEKAVTFIMNIKTDTDGELEKGWLYMVHNTKTNRLSAVGFVDKNDGYVQKYTAEEINRELKIVFNEYN